MEDKGNSTSVQNEKDYLTSNIDSIIKKTKRIYGLSNIQIREGSKSNEIINNVLQSKNKINNILRSLEEKIIDQLEEFKSAGELLSDMDNFLADQELELGLNKIVLSEETLKASNLLTQEKADKQVDNFERKVQSSKTDFYDITEEMGNSEYPIYITQKKDGNYILYIKPGDADRKTVVDNLKNDVIKYLEDEKKGLSKPEMYVAGGKFDTVITDIDNIDFIDCVNGDDYIKVEIPSSFNDLVDFAKKHGRDPLQSIMTEGNLVKKEE